MLKLRVLVWYLLRVAKRWYWGLAGPGAAA